MTLMFLFWTSQRWLGSNQVHGVRELITTLGETKTVLLSTHILQEVHAVCIESFSLMMVRLCSMELPQNWVQMDLPWKSVSET